MNNVIIGTAGHVDHGKTCLIRALTGAETDRLKEEKKRGITIELGFAEMPNPLGMQIGIIDVPGHEKFVRNMLAGIGGIDLVLLVIAADEGVMPQTVEHFEILKALAIGKGIIVITKTDLVESDWLELVTEDVKDAVKGTFLEGAPLIAVSSHTGENIDTLKELIFDNIKDAGGRRQDASLLRIPIDRVFTMEGFGTVITGTLLEGSVEVGDDVQIYPGKKIAKVRNLQVHGSRVEKAFAGQRTAVNLVNVKKDEVKRGDVIAAKGTLMQTMMLDAKIRMFDDGQRVLVNGSRLHLYYGSAETLCKAILLDRDVLKSGESGYVQLRMEEEIAVRKGDRFIIRFYSPVETIGGGIIIDANPTKHKRFRQETLDALIVKEKGEEEEILAQTLLEMSKTLPTYKHLAIKLGGTEKEVAQGMKRLVAKGIAIDLKDGTYAHKKFVNSVEQAALNILRDYHDKNPISSGMLKGEFRKRLTDRLFFQDIKSIEGLMRYIFKKGKIIDLESTVAHPDHKVEYKDEHIEIMKQIEKKYLDAGFQCPDIDEIVGGEKNSDLIRQIVESMANKGKLKKLTYQYYMHIDHWNEAYRRFKNHMSVNEKITLAEYRDILNTSRKYAVLVLEYLDQEKITAMLDDVRILL